MDAEYLAKPSPPFCILVFCRMGRSFEASRAFPAMWRALDDTARRFCTDPICFRFIVLESCDIADAHHADAAAYRAWLTAVGCSSGSAAEIAARARASRGQPVIDGIALVRAKKAIARPFDFSRDRGGMVLATPAQVAPLAPWIASALGHGNIRSKSQWEARPFPQWPPIPSTK